MARGAGIRPRTWTDAQLIEAAASSGSRLEVARKLGLSSSGSASKTLPPHARRLGIALPRSRQGGPRRWTDDELRRAVNGGGGQPPADSMKQVCRRLGLTQSGQEAALLKVHMRRLRLPIPHGIPGRRTREED